jgi:PAS domain S-box-containing protein
MHMNQICMAIESVFQVYQHQGGDMIIALIQNTALLLSLSLLYETFWLKHESDPSTGKKIVAGLFIGFIAVILMQTTWVMVPGIVFDTRSVLLAVSGVFFGGIPTLIAMAVAAVVRVLSGGDGMYMGLVVIFASGTLGTFWRRFQLRHKCSNSPAAFLMLGLIVHLFMLLSTQLLPVGIALQALIMLILPLFLVYTPATMLLSLLLQSQQRNFLNRTAAYQLKESEEKFRQLFENHAAVKLIIDPASGRLVDANCAAAKFYGWSREELKGMKIEDINTLPTEEIRIAIDRVLASSGVHFAFTHRIHDGSEIDVEVFSSKVLINGETLLHSIVHDVSEKRQLMSDLVAAKERAEESDRLKTMFLTNLSHEIRTPLNGILGFASVIMEDPGDAEATREYADIIHQSGHRLLALINDMVDISKIEAGVIQLEFEQVNVGSALFEVVQSFSRRATDKGLKIQADIPEEMHSFYLTTDGRKVHQVLSNYMNNAIKFSKQGGIVARCHQQDGEIVFMIKDEGIGIEKNIQDRVFERFFQAGCRLKDENPGAGLGLAICSGLAKLLNGRVWLESEPGVGSAFYFALPLKAE